MVLTSNVYIVGSECFLSLYVKKQKRLLATVVVATEIVPIPSIVYKLWKQFHYTGSMWRKPVQG
ncbi:UNVERIFIED_CONTAM: hypothetical protein NCL1_06111 [Trichonephila clavipes]